MDENLKRNSNNRFYFSGIVPSSKSLFNRALITQSYQSEIELFGQSTCDDVLKMAKALDDLNQSATTLDCGEAGTVLRFLAFRVARCSGTFKLIGKSRLLQRPQSDLLAILRQLGVVVNWSPEFMTMTSEGWKIPDSGIHVNLGVSSQFLSGLLLNAWMLPQTLRIKLSKERVSESYFQMTEKLLRDFGMEIHYHKSISSDETEMSIMSIPPNQKPKILNYEIESDLSSVFAVVALAVVAGYAEIKNFPFDSIQPDLAFIKILTDMGVEFLPRFAGQHLLTINQSLSQLKGVRVNLKETPDLFPVLSALASVADGESLFFGAPHLRFKETDRIAEVVSILNKLGIEARAEVDGAWIRGIGKNGTSNRKNNLVELDCHQDHRLVLMGAVLKAAGFNLHLKNIESVQKSFPEFLQIAQEFL